MGKLHHCILQFFYENLDAVKLLIQHGADCNCVDKDNTTPLNNAVDKGNFVIFKFLVMHGSDYNMPATYNYKENFKTILQHAIEYFPQEEDFFAKINVIDKFNQELSNLSTDKKDNLSVAKYKAISKLTENRHLLLDPNNEINQQNIENVLLFSLLKEHFEGVRPRGRSRVLTTTLNLIKELNIPIEQNSLLSKLVDEAQKNVSSNLSSRMGIFAKRLINKQQFTLQKDTIESLLEKLNNSNDPAEKSEARTQLANCIIDNKLNVSDVHKLHQKN